MPQENDKEDDKNKENDNIKSQNEDELWKQLKNASKSILLAKENIEKSISEDTIRNILSREVTKQDISRIEEKINNIIDTLIRIDKKINNIEQELKKHKKDK